MTQVKLTKKQRNKINSATGNIDFGVAVQLTGSASPFAAYDAALTNTVATFLLNDACLSPDFC